MRQGAQLAVAKRPRVRRYIAVVRRAEPVVPERVVTALDSLGPEGVKTASWAVPAPALWDTSCRLAEALAELAPRGIHVHDTFPLPAAMAHKRTRGLEGQSVGVAYDAHEWIYSLTQRENPPPTFRAMDLMESTFIRDADAVITVSHEMAGLLRDRYDLAATPAVVTNAPADAPESAAPSLRHYVGLEQGVPLLVYSGYVDAERGVDTVIAALAELPDVHFALVVGRRSPALSRALEGAVASGVSERVHVAGYVSPSQVPAYLSSADVGVIPLAASEQFDVSLPTKFREYLHARLPLIVSANKQMAAEIARTGVGVTFEPGDVASLVEAIRTVVSNEDSYREAITPELLFEHSWESQEPVLLGVYHSLGVNPTSGTDAALGGSALHVAVAPEPTPDPVAAPSLAYVSLSVGPVNSAGQAHAWAHAAIDHLGCSGGSFGGPSGFGYVVDRPHPRSRYVSGSDAEVLLQTSSHVLVDAFHSVLVGIRGADVGDELDIFFRRAVHLGLAAHGSEIRNPVRHAERLPESYFHDCPAEWRGRIDAVVSRNEAILEEFDGPVFVSTPDLLLDVPRATWLPLVVDASRWATSRPALESGRVPVVLHAPSRSVPPIKGSDIIVPVLEGLHEAGRIEYLAAEGVPHDEMPALVAQSDIVVDQIRTGSYGVAALEAMAAGRLVVGSVAADVRALLPEDVPVVDAPGRGFADAMDRVLDDLSAAHDVAQRGPAYVEAWHDGRASAAALEPWLRVGTPPVRSTRRRPS
jgi:glycosyltransferase involved in cell wall biosynthesis